MNVGIIGGGVMGEVILSSLIKKRIIKAQDIMVSDLEVERLAHLEKRYQITTTSDNAKLLTQSDITIFCVKPQKAKIMMDPLFGKFGQGQVIISIMAGVSLSTIQRLTGHSAVVRAMPNVPAIIGEGMTAWMASDAVSDRSCMIVKMIFQAFGIEDSVDSEDMIDAATAVSGSGPAYIFYMAENLMKAAMKLGFSAGFAHRLVQQTFRGAMNQWYHTGEEPEALRRSVTSKGGTTEAALNSFKKDEVPEIFVRAIETAYVRAGQLREIADGKPDPADSE